MEVQEITKFKEQIAKGKITLKQGICLLICEHSPCKYSYDCFIDNKCPSAKMTDSILSLLDSPDSPYILKSEVVKRIREIKNRYFNRGGYDDTAASVGFNEAIQKAVELFEVVRK